MLFLQLLGKFFKRMSGNAYTLSLIYVVHLLQGSEGNLIPKYNLAFYFDSFAVRN